MRIVVPRPGAVSSSSVAPRTSHNRFTIDSPIPSPEGNVAEPGPEPAASTSLAFRCGVFHRLHGDIALGPSENKILSAFGEGLGVVANFNHDD